MATKLYLGFFRNGVIPIQSDLTADFSRPGIGVTKDTLYLLGGTVIYCT